APPLCVFFFQAEDGIRDFHVTGVQTCALPICIRIHVPGRHGRLCDPGIHTTGGRWHGGACCSTILSASGRGPFLRGGRRNGGRKIGRASCRERVSVAEVAAWWQDKREKWEDGR